MLIFATAIALAIHWYLSVTSAKQILRGELRASDIFIVAHTFVLSMPIALDALWDRPNYSYYRLYNEAINDGPTYGIYLLYMTSCALLLAYSGHRWKLSSSLHYSAERVRSLRWLFVVLAISPIVYAAFSPNLEATLSYGYLQQYISAQPQDLQTHYKYLYFLTNVSVVAYFVVMSSLRTIGLQALLPMLGIVVSCYLNGKRNVVAFALALLIGSLWQRKALTATQLSALATVLIACYVGYHYAYAKSIRTFMENDEARLAAIRLDVGHDFDICAAIHRELYPTSPILEYRGETFLFAAVMLIPREYYPTKPYPYYRYLTAAVQGHPFGDQRWGFTSSFLGEAIANASWFGCIIAIALFLGVGRVVDSSRGLLSKSLGLLMGILLMLVDPSTCIGIGLLWAVALALKL
jgi:hypothetical protein